MRLSHFFSTLALVHLSLADYRCYAQVDGAYSYHIDRRVYRPYGPGESVEVECATTFNGGGTAFRIVKSDSYIPPDDTWQCYTSGRLLFLMTTFFVANEVTRASACM